MFSNKAFYASHKSNLYVPVLFFIHRWIKHFLDRRTVSRRKIIREKKNVPATAIIVEAMRKGQAAIINLRRASRQVLNLDETAVQWGLGPTHIYMPQNGDRGQGESSDLKVVT